MADEEDVQSLITTLDRFQVDIFSLEPTPLTDLATGISPSGKTVKEILQAIDNGEKRAKQFIDERLNKKEKAFEATLSKQKVPSFNAIDKSTPSTKSTLNKNRVPFAKLLIVGQSRNLNIKQLLEYETGSIPLSLFDEKGKMRKGKKSQLTTVLEDRYLKSEDFIDHSASSEKAIVIDAMVMVRMVKASGTFKEYSIQLFDLLLSESRGCKRIDVVFDIYDPDSIKSAERAKRGSQKMSDILILNGEMKIPKLWNDFLTNINNKNELVSFLIESWKLMAEKIPDGHTLIVSSTEVHDLTKVCPPSSLTQLVSNHHEADTRLLLHAADILKTFDLVVIRTGDTDILALAVHHLKAIVKDCANQDIVLYIGTGVHKRYLSVAQLCASMPANVLQNILPAYALTGCDTTNALFRISKARAVTT